MTHELTPAQRLATEELGESCGDPLTISQSGTLLFLCQKDAGHDDERSGYKRHRWDGEDDQGRPFRVLWGRPMTRHRETPHGDSTERQPRGEEGGVEPQPARNPLVGLWSKRNTPSGHFDRIKRSGDVFKGVKREN